MTPTPLIFALGGVGWWYALHHFAGNLQSLGKQPAAPTSWTIRQIGDGRGLFQSVIEVECYIIAHSERSKQLGRFSHMLISSSLQLPFFPVLFVRALGVHTAITPLPVVGHCRQIHVNEIPPQLKRAGRRKVRLKLKSYSLTRSVFGKSVHSGFSALCAESFDDGVDCPTCDLISYEIMPSFIDKMIVAARQMTAAAQIRGF